MSLFRREFQNCKILFEVLFEMKLHACGFLTDTSVIATVGSLSLPIQQVGTDTRITHKPSE